LRKLIHTFLALSISLSSWAQLSGIYTIGGGTPSYISFTEAVDSLISLGVNGPVIFNVRNGVYSEKLVIPAIVGANATNTITFQSENLDSTLVILQAAGTSALNHVIRFDGASNFIFSKMTIQNTNNTYSRVLNSRTTADSLTITSGVNRSLSSITPEISLTYYYGQNPDVVGTHWAPPDSKFRHHMKHRNKMHKAKF